MRKSAFLITGTHSGVGKTLTSYILMSLLKRKGLIVQPFKHGPDYIDPGYHQLATGNLSHNLDFWMMSTAHIQELFNSKVSSADIGVIEGMGALFDGENGTEKGSGAHLAKLLDIPVVLIVDVEGMTRSVNALLQGFLNFNPEVNFCGIVFNKVGSDKHYQMIYQNLEARYQQLSLGYLVRSRSLEVPERHLGLLTVEENPWLHKLEEVLIEAERTLDVERLLPSISQKLPPQNAIRASLDPKVRIGIALDKAFCFYYKKNLELLEEMGAELVPFSPIDDDSLPNELDGLYFGGGYPELFAEVLSDNTNLKKEILARSNAGMPIYAECGGFIYLCNRLVVEDKDFEMVGCFLPTVVWDRNYLAIRYVEITTREETIIGSKGTVVRGHEFHQTRFSKPLPDGQCVYSVTSSSQEVLWEGLCKDSTLGSYIHLYFPSSPSVAASWVNHCLKYKNHKISKCRFSCSLNMLKLVDFLLTKKTI